MICFNEHKMKPMKKYLCYLLFACALCQTQTVNAQDSEMQPSQFKTWSLGITSGFLAPYSPFGGHEEFGEWRGKLGYGVMLKKQINHYFSVKADVFKGDLKAYMPDFAKKLYFETDLHYVLNVSAVVNFLNLRLFKQDSDVQFYASVGGGVASYTPTNYFYSKPNYTTKPKQINMSIPVGFGGKYRLADALNFNIGWTINFVNADDLDNYEQHLYNHNDRFSYVHAGLEFNLGKGKQLAFHDPVGATYDEIRAAKKAVVELRAGLAAQQDEIVKLKSEMSNLLNDSDGDGVADKLDKCIGTPAGTVVDGAGCPLKLPTPIATPERELLTDIINNLEFAFGKATIKENSYPTLNKLATLLTSRNFTLKIAGHADDKGSDRLNMRLSKKRAEAVKAYLVSQGANPSRIEATGYGEGQPITSNQTIEGRKLNRRVEFTLY